MRDRNGRFLGRGALKPGATLIGANLSGANLIGATVDDGVSLFELV